MKGLDFFRTIKQYATPEYKPKAEYIYSIKFRVNIELGRLVWTRFKTKYPHQTLEFHVTKSGKVLLGGQFNKEHVRTDVLYNMVKGY